MRCSLKKNLNIIIIVVLLIVMILISLVVDSANAQSKNTATAATGNQTDAINAGKLVDNRDVYADDSVGSIKYLYVTVLNVANKGRKFEGAKDITFGQLNLLNRTNDRPANLEVICQEGDGTGPQVGMFGAKSRRANGVIQIRGSSTSGTGPDKKSYKITLNAKAGRWNSSKVLDLNKQPYDLTRVRNKLCFDLFKNIPNFTSLKTQFVRLYIKDLSTNDKEATYKDYGLFTQIEQPNKDFLSLHGLDSNGTIYKAKNFEFNRSPDVIKDDSDPTYKKSEFEKLLKRKEGKNNQKLIQMLDDVNNKSLNINDVIDKDFDRDNYLTWLATNMLLGNMDTKSSNFYLYSPSNSNKWYFLPWDYDGCLDFYHQLGSTKVQASDWENGISNYWGTVLGKKFFSDKNNVIQLENKMDELSKIINSDSINKLLKIYYPNVLPIVSTPSETYKLPSTLENFKTEYWRIANIPSQNKSNFNKEIQKPMPFFLGDLKKKDGEFVLDWGKSYDLQGDSLTYNFTLASDPGCKNVILQQNNIYDLSYSFKPLQVGTYYWKVTVTDSQGNTQGAFDKYTDEFKDLYQGVKQLVVE